ncbi:hypothetical protein Tco_0480110, partial [Tanacetum coccineum]
VSWLASAADTLASINCSTAAAVIGEAAVSAAAVAIAALAPTEVLFGGTLF